MLTFGILPSISQRGLGLDRLLEEIVAEAQQAEESGFSSVLLAEHHQQKVDMITSPLLAAMAIAVQTKRIRVGTGVLVAPLYHPVHVAEDIALIDNISHGRFILGLAIGYQEDDFTAFDVPRAERVSRTEEFVDVLRRCWTQDSFTFHGKHYDFENVRITPKPFRKPHPPIWIGGVTDAAISRAARIGDGWLIDPNLPRDLVKEGADRYRDLCAKNGTKPYVGLLRQAWVAESRDKALAECEETILNIWRYYWRVGALYEEHYPFMKDVKSAADLTIERIGMDRFIIGSPTECISQIEWWQREVGIDHLCLLVRRYAGPPLEQVLSCIKLFGQAVIPHFAS